MSTKKRMRSLLVLVLGTILFSCSSSDDVQENGTDEFIVASVDGISFETSSTRNSVAAAKIDSGESITYTVQGTNDAGNGIVLTITEFEGVGTYDLALMGATNGTGAIFSNQETAFTTAVGEGGGGSIIVAVDNGEETSGTFEFVGLDVNDPNSSIMVTSGSFRADFEDL